MTPTAAIVDPAPRARGGSAVWADLVRRAGSPDYERWRAHVAAAAACAHPVRLAGQLHTVEPATGRIVETAHTADLPDGVVYVPCGNRRAVVCPACSETYRADTFHLVRAGLAGGKGVPDTVAAHPCVFLTGTADTFGPVHTHHRDGKPCRPRRHPDTCPHGVVLDCRARHTDDDPLVGRPLCLDCYDHDHQVVWNAYAGELWRRTMNTANRRLRTLADRHGTRLRLSYAKVAEFQRRGVAHIHAMVRLDGIDPDHPDAIVAPPAGLTAGHLEQLLRGALTDTAFTTDPHPDQPTGWRIAWGPQIDPRQVRLTVRDVDDRGEITTCAVAGYLAKYATKATETTGHASARLTPATVRTYTDEHTHPGRLVAACWRLGTVPADVTDAHRAWARRHPPDDPPDPDDPDPLADWQAGYGRLRRWAHMLGFGGHFSTKSRRYSTTLGALRRARRDWRGARPDDTGPDHDQHDGQGLDDTETTVVINSLAFAGIGWHTTADALLANTAAANAREHRRTAREELATTRPI